MGNIRIRPIDARDVETIGRLFTYYPYKTAQQVIQKIERPRLEAFFLDRFGSAAQGGKPFWVMQDSAELIGLAGLAGLEWHAAIYGMKMGRIDPWLNTINAEAGVELLTTVEGAARRAGYEHLSIRIDGADFPNLHLLESEGWRTVDISVKFSRPLPIRTRRARTGSREARMHVGTSEQEDGPWIRHVGASTHTATHYLNDPALPAEKTNGLFGQWLDRCLEGLAYRIYTLKNGDGQGLGFITFLKNEAFARAIGRRPLVLDFVLLDPSARGRGLGSWFIEEALKAESPNGFDFCELRTSMHNLAAVGCYEKQRFQCCSTDFVLHKTL
jgi:GNAT superfamily N-acetyltransferase